jgi:4-amino-4-deoxy-L-arabinose transferase-like glycosyltransferase
LPAKKLLFCVRTVYKDRFMMAALSGPTLRNAGIVLVVLYVAAGVIYSCLLPTAGRFSDEREYLALADHLLHGPGFSMDGTHATAARAPGYPFFMFVIQALGGGVVAIRISQFLLTGGIILLVARLVAEEHRSAALLTTTAIVALYPLFFYTSATLYPQTLAAFLLMLGLAMLIRPKRALPGNIVIGAIFGFLILVVPTFLFTLVVMLAVAWWLKIVRLRDSALVLAVAVCAVGIWTARNYIQFHEFVPIASNSGANFLIGNCESTIPTGGSGNVNTTHYHQEAQALGLNEFQQDHYYRAAAFAWIRVHPGHALMLYFEKAANFFNVYNEYAPESRGEVTPWRQAVLGACYGLLLALLVWRLVEANRFPLSTTERLFLAIYVLSAFTQAIFFTRIRLRLPYDYLVVAIIAQHLARRLEAWRAPAHLTKST